MAQANDSKGPPLLTDTMAVHNHGDWENDSVGVIIPSGARDVLDISASTTLTVFGYRDKLVVSPAEIELPDAHSTHERSACERSKGSILQVNIPTAARRMLGVEPGDRMRARSYHDRLEYQPAVDALGLEQ